MIFWLCAPQYCSIRMRMSSEKTSPSAGIAAKIEALLLGLFFVVGGVFRTAFAFSFMTSKLLATRKVAEAGDQGQNPSERPGHAPPMTFFFLTLVAGLLLIGAYVRPFQRAYEMLKKNPVSKPSPDSFGGVSLEEQFGTLSALLPSRDAVEGVSAAASKMSLSDLALSMLPYIGCLALLACCLFLVLRVLRRPLPFTQSLEVSAYFAGSLFFWGSICVCLILPWEADLKAKFLPWIETLPTDPHADAKPYLNALHSIRNSVPTWKSNAVYAAMFLAACTPILAGWGFIRLLWLRAASFAVAVVATFLSIGLFYISFKVMQPVVSPIIDSMRVSEPQNWFRLPKEK
jgi:hypothetical protein